MNDLQLFILNGKFTWSAAIQLGPESLVYISFIFTEIQEDQVLSSKTELKRKRYQKLIEETEGKFRYKGQFNS